MMRQMLAAYLEAKGLVLALLPIGEETELPGVQCLYCGAFLAALDFGTYGEHTREYTIITNKLRFPVLALSYNKPGDTYATLQEFHPDAAPVESRITREELNNKIDAIAASHTCPARPLN